MTLMTVVLVKKEGLTEGEGGLMTLALLYGVF